MAAVAMAAAYGVPMDSIRKTIKEFAELNTVLNLWQRRMVWHNTMIPGRIWMLAIRNSANEPSNVSDRWWLR